MELVVPEVPSHLATDWDGWIGTVIAGNHSFLMHASYYPDHHSNTFVKWIGFRRESETSWKMPTSLKPPDCWSDEFDPDIRWLEGGSSAGGWQSAFEKAAEDLVTKLKPEFINKVQYGWDNPPERARK